MWSPLIELSLERGRIQLRLCCLRMGEDLCVTLSGGDREHIGAVALSQPRPSQNGGGPTTPTTAVLTCSGHKEDELAKQIAAQVATHTGATVCVACGIHVDAILPKELSDVLAMAEELTRSLLQRLAEQGQ